MMKKLLASILAAAMIGTALAGIGIPEGEELEFGGLFGSGRNPGSGSV